MTQDSFPSRGLVIESVWDRLCEGKCLPILHNLRDYPRQLEIFDLMLYVGLVLQIVERVMIFRELSVDGVFCDTRRPAQGDTQTSKTALDGSVEPKS